MIPFAKCRSSAASPRPPPAGSAWRLLPSLLMFRAKKSEHPLFMRRDPAIPMSPCRARIDSVWMFVKTYAFFSFLFFFFFFFFFSFLSTILCLFGWSIWKVWILILQEIAVPNFDHRTFPRRKTSTTRSVHSTPRVYAARQARIHTT